MLYIRVGRDSFCGAHAVYEWEEGDSKPVDENGDSFSQVYEIYADFQELAYIRNRFRNLPDCNDVAVTWQGEWAQFIYNNLTKAKIG